MLMLKDEPRCPGLALYSDRHGIFQRSPKEPESLAEQLRGRRDPTQFGRALEELDIRLILAHSPQAKGRIERIWGSFQDAWSLSCASLAHRPSSRPTRCSGTSCLASTSDSESPQHSQAPPIALTPGVSLEASSTSALWPTTTPSGSTAPPSSADDLRASYARAKVEVQERLDGSTVVITKARPWPQSQPPTGILRARNGRRSNGHVTSTGASTHSAQKPNPRPTTKTKTGPPRKPAPNHPWRRPLTDIIIEHLH